MQINEFDTIPLPTDRARDKLPFMRIVRDHPAWPNQELRLYFEWNEPANYWVWRVEVPGHGDIITRQPVQYASNYQFRGYLTFIFLDLSRNVEQVTPHNLGEAVDLVAIPGPESPGWVDWVNRQQNGVTSAAITG